MGVQEQFTLILGNDLGLLASQNCSIFYPKTTCNLTAEVDQVANSFLPILNNLKAHNNYISDFSLISLNQAIEIKLNYNQHSYLLFAPKSININPVVDLLNKTVLTTVKYTKISN